MNGKVALGLALGKTAEYVGLAVLEVVKNRPLPYGNGLTEHHLIYLQSLPPGTKYELIITQLRRIIAACDVIYIVVDQTAVGAPIVRLISEELNRNVYPVIIGGQHSERQSTGVDYVPKQDLISEVNVALIKGRIRISKGLKEAGNLSKGLVNYENLTTSPALSDPWREHPSDHLIFAVALACWKLQHPSYFYYDK